MKNRLPVFIALMTLLISSALSSMAAECPAARKPLLVVLIYDESCVKACGVVRPIVQQLAAGQAERVQYVELNMAPGELRNSEQRAAALGIRRSVEDRTDQVPIVLYFAVNGEKVKMLKELPGHKSAEVYKTWLDKYLEKPAK